MDVLLLAQPAGQAVFVDAAEDGENSSASRTAAGSGPSPNTPVQRRGAQSLFDDVTGEQEGGTCGRQHTLKPLSLVCL